METRQLGKSGIAVAPLAFGGNVFGWTIDEATSFQLLDAFVAAGFNLVDTADVYSRWVPGNKGGESETIIGNWLKRSGKRKEVIVATKVGADKGQGKDVSKKHILQSVEESLQRLQTDYIDLYQTHYDNEATPVEETLEAYTQLVKEGKVRAIGASNISAARLKASLEASEKNGYARYETLQPLYNLYERQDFEEQYAPLCEKYNLSVLNYYALASGFLSGKYRSEADLGKSARGAGIKKYLNDRGFRILHALDEVAARYNATPAQVSLAWVASRKNVAAPIASATSLQQLNDLIKSTTLNLDTAAITQLDQASAWGS